MVYQPPYPLWIYPTCAFLGMLMCAIPFPWHLEAWNTGTCLFMFWTSSFCLVRFVDSILFQKTMLDHAPLWCDISTRWMIAFTWAIPATSLCINRRLFHIASVQSVTVSKSEKRRAILVDLALGLGLPIFGMIIYYIPQGHRYDIFQELGCNPAVYNTTVAMALVFAPPLAIGLVSGTYASCSIWKLYKRHRLHSELLSGNSGITSSRYIRLMALASMDLIFSIPSNSFIISLNAPGVLPWISWEHTHADFWRVDQFAAITWRRWAVQYVVGYELSRWAPVLCAVVFFAFFGFADEARKHYRTAVESVAKKMGYSTFSINGSTMGSTSQSGATDSVGKRGPGHSVMVHKEILSSRHRSIDSFTNISVDEEKDRSFNPIASYNNISFNDVGGALSPSTDGSSPPSTTASRKPSLASLTENPTTVPAIQYIDERPRLESEKSPV